MTNIISGQIRATARMKIAPIGTPSPTATTTAAAATSPMSP